MKALLQRVSQASVEVIGVETRRVGKGLLVFFGVEKADKPEWADQLAKKLLAFRIFEDEQERMNLSVTQVQGEILVVSQFTLCADNQKGSKPSFDSAAAPEIAEPIYQRFVEQLRQSGLTVRTGTFGAAMRVQLINEGPATFLLELS